ncbi:MAG TPA: hypothetical protein VKK31_27070 [Thermoanaerobaculia bacterium]|nr:hypothetical protein [Thermoanaerobaculia bacterium]
MKNLKKLLFAAALVAAAIVSAPPKAEATAWCDSCAASGYTHCFSCCKCAGETNAECIRLCE